MTVSPAPLPNGRITLSRLGLGTAALGGLYRAVTPDEAAATVRTAHEHGITHVDTAPLYGHGLAEQQVGEALRRLDRPVVLSTKVGRLVRSADHREPGDLFLGAPPGRARFDFSADGIIRSVETSLERLGLDRIDILFVHDPDDHLDQAIEEAIPAAVHLRDSGLVDAIGAGMNDAAPLTRIVEETDVDLVLVAGRLSLLDRSATHELLPVCRRRRVGVVVGGVFNSGVLADPATTPMYDYAPAPEAVRATVAAMSAACRRHGLPLRAAALQEPFRHDGVTSVLLGARSPAEVRDGVALLDVHIPDELRAELDELAHTHAHASARADAGDGSAAMGEQR